MQKVPANLRMSAEFDHILIRKVSAVQIKGRADRSVDTVLTEPAQPCEVFNRANASRVGNGHFLHIRKELHELTVETASLALHVNAVNKEFAAVRGKTPEKFGLRDRVRELLPPVRADIIFPVLFLSGKGPAPGAHGRLPL